MILHLALQWVAMLEWLKAAAKACCWVATTGASLENQTADWKEFHWAVKTAGWTALQWAAQWGQKWVAALAVQRAC